MRSRDAFFYRSNLHNSIDDKPMSPKPLTTDEIIVADAVAGLTAQAGGPIDFLRLAFGHCCQFEGVAVAACWVKNVRQQVVLLSQYGIEVEARNTAVPPTGELRRGLSERFGASSQVDVNADFSQATKGLTLHWLSINVGHESKAAISLWRDSPIRPNEALRQQAFSRAIQTAFASIVAEVKRSRTPNQWRRVGASGNDGPSKAGIRSAGKAAAATLDRLSDSMDRINSVVPSADASGPLPSDRVLQMAKVIGRSLDKRAVAYDIANELRCLLGRGRIGLAYVQGEHAKLVALSGVETFDERSEVVITLRRLCSQVAKSQQPIWHPEQAGQQPRQIAKRIEDYYEATDAQSIALIPIHAPAEISADPNDLAAVLRRPDGNEGQLVALLTIEGLRETIGQQDFRSLWRDAEPIVANAIWNSLRHSNIFLYPVWKAVGSGFQLFRGHHRNKAIASSVMVALIVVAMGLLPWPHRVKADGVLLPVRRARLYAEVAGTIDQIKVADGQAVSAGEAVLTLANPEMDVEIERVKSDQRHAREMMIAIRNQLNGSGGQEESSDRGLRKERASLEAKLISLERQFQILSTKHDKLSVISPIAGKVMTWDLTRRLANRPVEPGMHLLTIADESGPWELELCVPDRLTGHLNEALQRQEPGERLSVDFVSASDPRRVLHGEVRAIAESQTFDDVQGSVLRVYVDIAVADSRSLSQFRSGTEAIAHIHVGKRSLGYTFFYELFDWFDRMWFRYT